MNIPSHFKLQYSQEQINFQIKLIAQSISTWALTVKKDTGLNLILVPILKGGIFACVDLMRAMAAPCELGYAVAKSYNAMEMANQNSEIAFSIEHLKAEGRTFLLVDEICDSGRTFKVLAQALRDKGAQEVKTFSLVRRDHAASMFTPDFTCFSYQGNEWFVGYGLQEKQLYRNLTALYTIPAG